LKILGNVNEVLEEYNHHLPLTIRQIFYRLVAQHNYPKTEQDYKTLCRILNMARRAGEVDMEAIRDDGADVDGGWSHGYKNVADFWESVWWGIGFDVDQRFDVSNFKFNRLAAYPRHIEVWSEAAGMVPLIKRATDSYVVTVYSGGGFDSLTAKYSAAERIASRGKPTVVLHVGDHDPSGVALYQAVSEDVEAFVDAEDGDGEVEFKRLAVTPEQAAQYDLPSAPPKPTDKRGAWSGSETWQVEAFAPDDLAEVVRQGVRAELDLSALAQQRAEEQRIREQLAPEMERLRQRLHDEIAWVRDGEE